MIPINEEYYIYGGSLQHHGIDGQKWGVKNGPPYPLESQKWRDKKKERKALKRRDKILKDKIKNRKYLTNDEIDLITERLIKEKRLNELYLDNTPKAREAADGKKATADTLKKIGSSVFGKVASTVLTGAMLYAIGSLMAGRNPDLAKSMVTGKASGIGKDD